MIGLLGAFVMGVGIYIFVSFRSKVSILGILLAVTGLVMVLI